MNDRFERAGWIVARALELDAGTVPAFLDEACDGDDALRREVEELLAERDAVPWMLRTAGSAELPGAARAEPDVPERIGPYRIRSVLGEGGMGTVYLAEQEEPIRRRVALKVIRPGLDTRSVVARFETERQTLARLAHPGIAQVHDAGTTPLGRPYFVMEYVPGEPITRFCESRDLGLPERLRLFVAVCRAIHHAHQRGVIHRDVKPSNVLVTDESGGSLPKVIDFGIAKATTEAPLADTAPDAGTLPGQIVGTPEYMSPEQADPGIADIDVRTDVYSLGVLLYELLTGAPPIGPSELRRGGIEELRRRIREEEAPPPSRRVPPGGRARALRGDLDWITIRALEKDRERRYGSAADLADEVERHLAGEPVEAGPPSTVYRLRKLVRRHRAAFAGLTGVFLAMAAGLAASTTLWLRAENAREEAALQARKAERANEFLQTMLASADPEVDGRDVTVRDVLDRAAETLDSELADDPAVRAGAHVTLGNTYDGLGRYEEAERHLAAALALHRELLPAGHRDLAGNLNDLGVVLNHLGRYEEAESVFREAVGILDSGEDRSAADDARANLAVLLKDLGRYEEAEPLYRAAVVSGRVEPGPGLTLARRLSNLGVLLRVQGKAEEAIETYREALAMAVEHGGEDDPQAVTIRANLASALTSAGRYQEAEPIALAVLEADRRQLGEEHPYVAGDLANLATLYRNLEDYVRAEELAEKSAAIRRRVLGEDHPSVAKSLMILGEVRRDAGRTAEAEGAFRRAVAVRRAALPEDHPDRAWAEARLGDCLRELGRRKEAEELLLSSWDSVQGAERGSGARREQIAGFLVALYEGWKPEAAERYRETGP